MKRIVVIGANYFQRPLIVKAKSLGYETHVFAWDEGAVSKNDADYFYPISIVDKEIILEYCYKIKPDAVLSIGSDLAIITVNYLAEKLNLIGNSMKSTLKSTNKYEMRKALDFGGVSIPRYKEYVLGQSDASLLELDYPVIVKPVDRSGSRGVEKVSKSKYLKKALEEACKQSFMNRAIIEEFIEGEEFSCESISYRGKHHILAITKKYTTEAPHFIEIGHIEPSGIEKKYGLLIQKEIFKGLDSLGIENGASHSEFKITQEGNIKIIEIGSRMGGDCIGSHLVPISTGVDYVKMCIDISLGKEPFFNLNDSHNIAAVRFVFNKADYAQYLDIQKKYPENIQEVHLEELTKNINVLDSSSRWGYYIMEFRKMSDVNRIGLF